MFPFKTAESILVKISFTLRGAKKLFVVKWKEPLPRAQFKSIRVKS